MENKKHNSSKAISKSPILERMLRSLPSNIPEFRDVATQTESFNTMQYQHDQYSQYLAYYQYMFWLSHSNNVWNNLYQLNHIRYVTQQAITMNLLPNTDSKKTVTRKEQRKTIIRNPQSWTGITTPMVGINNTRFKTPYSSTTNHTFYEQQISFPHVQNKNSRRKQRLPKPKQQSTQNSNAINRVSSTMNIDATSPSSLQLMTPPMKKIMAHIDQKNGKRNKIIMNHKTYNPHLSVIPEKATHETQPYVSIPSTSDQHDIIPPTSNILTSHHQVKSSEVSLNDKKKKNPSTLLQPSCFQSNIQHQTISPIEDITLQPFENGIQMGQDIIEQILNDQEITSLSEGSLVIDLDSDMNEVKPLDLSNRNT